jgi:hypothetical protein
MSQQYESLIQLFYKTLNEIEINNCLACFYESNSQKGHTCYGLQRSIDGKETKYLFAKDALELLLSQNTISISESDILEKWLRQRLIDLREKNHY